MIKELQSNMAGEDRIIANLLYERLGKARFLSISVKKFLKFISEDYNIQKGKEIKRII
ncbi:MAG: hypothetical protein BWY64_02943 [bacterium ADurb.Bin363]|nr:MAG: hypothetical protein BWY64_02943 [bacterium ADurb.Bin363]